MYYQMLCNTPDESSVAGLQQKRLHARDFDVIRVIGRGAFGEVQLVSVCLNVVQSLLTPWEWDYTNVSS